MSDIRGSRCHRDRLGLLECLWELCTPAVNKEKDGSSEKETCPRTGRASSPAEILGGGEVKR